MTKTALIAGQGLLPALLAGRLSASETPFIAAALAGFPASIPGLEVQQFRLERLVPFLDDLIAQGVERVVFAGAVRRPRLEPELFDARSATLVPRLVTAMQQGDDAALRAVIAVFEEWGLEVVGADAVDPALVPGEGVLAGVVSEADRRDAARAAEIVAALGALDIGQGAVVAQGLCIGVEALPGTDALLATIAGHLAGLRPDATGASGLLFKAPKPGQDRRVDLPTLGVETVRGAARAGLGGIAWEAGGVICLDVAGMCAEAEARGLFLWSRRP